MFWDKYYELKLDLTMQLKTEKYTNYLNQIPAEGQHILAQQTADQIIVYQAFNPNIARFAVEHQCFGGDHYSYTRMSWIKPNFLWMMYRCGWASKENQKRVLAIWIQKSDFDTILENAAYTSFQAAIYGDMKTWKAVLAEKAVRLQWDPDHDPYGKKQVRRAVQLGLKGEILERFGKEMIHRIEDITDFVQAQKAVLDTNPSALLVPEERVYLPADLTLCQHIGIIKTQNA